MRNNPIEDSAKVREYLLFSDMEIKPLPIGKTCRTCAHRVRYELSEFSVKIIQCCELQPSKRSKSGLKTIKVTNPACADYEE